MGNIKNEFEENIEFKIAELSKEEFKKYNENVDNFIRDKGACIDFRINFSNPNMERVRNIVYKLRYDQNYRKKIANDILSAFDNWGSIEKNPIYSF